MADLKTETKASVDKARKAALGLPARTSALGLHSVLLELAELRSAISTGAPFLDLNEISRKKLEQARSGLADPSADDGDRDVSSVLTEMFTGLSREIRAIRELSAWGSAVALSSVAFVVKPAVTAATPNGVALVPGVRTTPNFGTPGQVAVDVTGLIASDIANFAAAVVALLLDSNIPNNLTLDNITQITARSHTNLSDIGTNTHIQIDAHVAAANPHSGSQPLDTTLTSLAAIAGVAGDLLYASGADAWARLAKSTDGFVLTLVAGLPAWAAAAAGYTDEQAQDAVGVMLGSSLIYVDATPLLARAALTGDVTAAQDSNATTIAADAVTNAKLANMATATIKGRTTAGTGDPEDLTAAQALAVVGGEPLQHTGVATIDFGAFPGASDAALVITGQTAILAGSIVEAWLVPIATADHTADEHLVEPIKVLAGKIVAGTSFTIYGVCANQLNEPPIVPHAGSAQFSTTSGTVGFRLCRAGVLSDFGGKGPRLWGTWTVQWRWS